MNEKQLNKYKQLKDVIENSGGKLISEEFINNNTEFIFICGYCNSEHSCTFHKTISRSGYCPNCRYERASTKMTTEDKLKKYEELRNEKIKEIADKLAEENCIFISVKSNHKNIIRSIVYFRCGCGEVDSKSLEFLLSRPFCSSCVRKKTVYNPNLTNSEVEKIILENSDCLLISKDYKNRDSILVIKCKCGEIFETYIDRFQRENKRQCNKCGIDKRSGENSPRWKGGITSESDKIRKTKEYREWRNKTFERDRYTCQCCENSVGGNLQAHHIYNFSEHEDLIYELTNAITMCRDCHSPEIFGSFHNTYGTHNNDIYQLQEYFDDIRMHLGLPLIKIEDIIYQTKVS